MWSSRRAGGALGNVVERAVRRGAWRVLRRAGVALLAAPLLACASEDRDCTCAEYCDAVSPSCGTQADCSDDCDAVDETFFNCVCYYRSSRPAGSVCDECMEE